MIKEGAVVIDVGINRLENKKLCGDVEFESATDFSPFRLRFYHYSIAVPVTEVIISVVTLDVNH